MLFNKKLWIFGTAVCLIAISSNADVQAQATRSSFSGSISVNTNVLQSIDMVTLRNMTFGKIQPGQREVFISPVLDEKAGKMKASGIPGAPIRVSYLEEWQLTRSQGPGTLTFYYEVSGNKEDNQSASEILETDNRDLSFNSEGEFYFWIGGRVNIQNASPGNYEGEFTIEIEYL